MSLVEEYIAALRDIRASGTGVKEILRCYQRLDMLSPIVDGIIRYRGSHRRTLPLSPERYAFCP